MDGLREVMHEEVCKEIMCRMDAAAAHAVVDGLGAASEAETVRQGMEAGDTVPVLHACTIALTGASLAVVLLGQCRSRAQWTVTHAKGCDEGFPALPLYLYQLGVQLSGARNWGLCFQCPKGRWWGVMLAILLT
jgi:hypothetical protein